jgi:hypothetical protein
MGCWHGAATSVPMGERYMTDILSIVVLDWLLDNSRELPNDVKYRLYHVTHDSMPPIHLINVDLIRYILFNSGFTKASEISRGEE